MFRMLLPTLLALGLVAEARASFETPAGLQPGDQFRIVFVTTTTTQATSSDITYYDSIVQADAAAAGLATYNGSPVTWSALASTATISAVSRLPTDSVPIYLIDGTEVAAGGSALWNSLNINIDETATGLVVPDQLVWTGTNPNGGVTNAPLGHPAVTVGSTSLAVSEASSEVTWIDYEAPVDTLQLSLYGFSSVLTVPEVTATPEPASITLALVGMGVLFGARLARRLSAPARLGMCPPAHF